LCKETKKLTFSLFGRIQIESVVSFYMTFSALRGIPFHNGSLMPFLSQNRRHQWHESAQNQFDVLSHRYESRIVHPDFTTRHSLLDLNVEALAVVLQDGIDPRRFEMQNEVFKTSATM
jgi:hypothetical protein